ncbi:MAG: PIN domain-containing protein [Saprospiraceae bacterium]|nr:PIN domain-containing protein [Saprospiraceae bacterium]MCF8251354.1 PIN domain-containing protein [Saprospiraceae bacterium]MCF8280529.1 PIN domain-containing protein [Bacteroidales bacterium]MCF8313253.1 PIN domain-containing protein [Saprospiraceae bacterium]MCF8441700.1 PIN domain-containing protein [Saprospiraceae bacterium]
MDKVFVDTNVLIDHLAERQPFCQSAKQIFQLAETGQIQMCASTLSICNIAYIIRKLRPETAIVPTLEKLSNLVSLTNIDETVITLALKAGFKDFEDAVQHFSALNEGGVTHLITRNPSDFEKSLLLVYSPEEYLKQKV